MPANSGMLIEWLKILLWLVPSHTRKIPSEWSTNRNCFPCTSYITKSCTGPTTLPLRDRYLQVDQWLKKLTSYSSITSIMNINKTGNQGLSNPNRRKARDDMGRNRLKVWNQITFLSLFLFLFFIFGWMIKFIQTMKQSFCRLMTTTNLVLYYYKTEVGPCCDGKCLPPKATGRKFEYWNQPLQKTIGLRLPTYHQSGNPQSQIPQK